MAEGRPSGVIGAFKTLEKNEMVLNACAIDLGSQYRRRDLPGDGRVRPEGREPIAQVASQQWRFTMNKIADEWKIQAATASADR